MARERDGALEVLLIYRSTYGDWGFPKGKVEDGETDEACALREVAEETGLACELGRELGSTRYIDARGREKSVRYWSMAPLEEEAAPGDGVDAIRWVPAAEAASLLTHERDREILGAFAPGASAP